MAFSFSTPAVATSTPSFSFGQSSTPAFGGLQKTASTPLFGSTAAFGAASMPSLFGASSGGSFGFSSSQPAQSAPSFFGTPNTAPGGTMFAGGFGATQSMQPLFGQSQQQLALLGFSGVPPQAPDLTAIRELESIKDSFVPAGTSNPRYRFQHLFLNVVDDPAQRVKPADVDELAWREALQRAGGANNPNKLWPVLARGFGDLLARRSAQVAALKEQSARMAALTSSVASLASRQETLLRERLEAIQNRHASLAHQLLKLLRRIDALEGRLASALGQRSIAQRAALKSLQAELIKLESEISPKAGGGLKGRIEPLAAAARMRAGAPMAGSSSELRAVDSQSLESLHNILTQSAAALSKITQVAQRAARDIAVLELKSFGEDAVMG